MSHVRLAQSTPCIIHRHVPCPLCRSNIEDPYLKVQDSEDDTSEIEDLTFKPDDLIILAARNEDDVSHLEACCPLEPYHLCLTTTPSVGLPSC